MTPRLLCARFSHLGLVAAWRRHPELRDEPVVLLDTVDALASRVVAASEAAHAAGVRPGQQLRQARQHCPGAVLLAVDAAAVEELRSALLATLCELAPAVELGDEEAWCDLSGRHALLGGELAWAAAVARGLADALAGPPGQPGVSARGTLPAVGLGSTRHVAQVAARLASPGRVRRVRPGEEAAVLAPLPVGVLPADPVVLARLGDLGLDRVGQVAALSPADLQRQFGPAGLALLRLARGEVEEPLDPYRQPRVMAERTVLDGPVSDLEVLRRCAERAAAVLGGQLLARGLVATRVELTLEPETCAGAAAGPAGSNAWSGWRVPPVPAGSVADLWPAVLGLLGSVRPTGPVAALRLLAGGLEPAAGRQTDMWRRGDASRDAIAIAVTRLRDRFGAETVLHPRLAVDPGDLPERRFVWEVDVADARAASTARRLPAPIVAPASTPSRDGAAALVAMPCPPTGTRPPTIRGDRRPDWRDGEGPVSRVRRERPAADGSRVDSPARPRVRAQWGNPAS
jgi:nucleotidyltransferase/DNA polymerase involved in DNA repair